MFVLIAVTGSPDRQPDPIATAYKPAVSPATIETDRLFGGLSLSVTAAALIDGISPTIAVSCADHGSSSLFLGLVRPVPRPPALHGNFATIRFDADKPIRFEANWVEKGSWTQRDMPERAARQLAIRLAKARQVTVDGLQPYSPSPVTWTVDLPDLERQRFIRQCQR